jgi:ABC-type multidrug transport system ATPase subunit
MGWQVMEELGLSELRDSLVGGGEVRGLSGGERRRVSIGHELVSDCDVLFLDEPTSGLDSSTAESVMQCIVDLSNRGRLAVGASIAWRCMCD